MALTSDERSLDLLAAGRPVEIVARIRDTKLKETPEIVLRSRGFANHVEASTWGSHLKASVQIASVLVRIGVDAGSDAAIFQTSEDVKKAMEASDPPSRIHDDLFGLMVIPDDDNNRFFSVSGAGSSSFDPKAFIEALSLVAKAEVPELGASGQAILAFNRALLPRDPLAQMTLAFSAVESLGQNENWTPDQKRLLSMAASYVGNELSLGTEEERLEVATAIGQKHKLSLRQGVRRLLGRLGLSSRWADWEKLYSVRSGVIHGNSPLSDVELSQLSSRVIALCGAVVIRSAEKEGLPDWGHVGRHYASP